MAVAYDRAVRHLLSLSIVAACSSPDGAPSGDTSGVATEVGTTDDTGSGESTGTTTSADTTSTGVAARACNGAAVLCDRPLDRVTFATTHNSAASTAAGFTVFNANQVHDLRRQLDDGIRGMMLDVTEFEGAAWLCHGPCGLGKLLHTEALVTLGEFLDANPDEVLFIIYEDSTTADAIAADWQAVGLESLLFTKTDRTWPTLGEMIDAGTRVVVTAENGSPPPAWFHHAWDLVWDTPYTFHAVDEFTCDANRGSPGSGLLLVNHWLSTDADLPDADAAAVANAQSLLQGRAQACAEQWQHPVNLLAVDFYDTGDLFAVVDALNGV